MHCSSVCWQGWQCSASAIFMRWTLPAQHGHLALHDNWIYQHLRCWPEPQSCSWAISICRTLERCCGLCRVVKTWLPHGACFTALKLLVAPSVPFTSNCDPTNVNKDGKKKTEGSFIGLIAIFWRLNNWNIPLPKAVDFECLGDVDLARIWIHWQASRHEKYWYFIRRSAILGNWLEDEIHQALILKTGFKHSAWLSTTKPL